MKALDEAFVTRLLTAFYDKVHQDPELGPVFDRIIGDGWPAHVRRIESFWRMALRISRGYHGPDFMPAHLQHEMIRADQLERWLALFEQTVDEVAPPSARERLMLIASAMAANLRIGLERRDL